MRCFVLLLFLALTNNCFGQAGDEPIFDGNRFVLGSKTGLDTDVVVDPITGQEAMRAFETDPLPVSMNGVHISPVEDVDTPATPIVPASSVEEQIIAAFKDIWAQFPYEITLLIGIKHIIVDGKGKIVYTDYSGLRAIDGDGAIRELGSPEPETLFKNITLKPAVKRGYKVLCVQPVFMAHYEVKVKDHQLAVRRK